MNHFLQSQAIWSSHGHSPWMQIQRINAWNTGLDTWSVTNVKIEASRTCNYACTMLYKSPRVKVRYPEHKLLILCINFTTQNQQVSLQKLLHTMFSHLLFQVTCCSLTQNVAFCSSGDSSKSNPRGHHLPLWFVALPAKCPKTWSSLASWHLNIAGALESLIFMILQNISRWKSPKFEKDKNYVII